MKKILLTAALFAAGIAASAQDWSDGLRFSDNEYEGTARTIAMGNAFTALGGDMGALGINPAGSAVARRSQFTVSFGQNISIGTAQGVRTPDGNIAFGKNLQQTDSRFCMPNIGGMVNFNTGRSRGIKNWSMGFVANNTTTYNDFMTAKGRNMVTSAFGELGVRATDLAGEYGFKASDLDNDAIFDRIPVSDWNIANAYRAGSIWALSDTEFAGISEYEDASGIGIGASGIDQHFGRTRSGAKSDFVYNLAFNVSDVLYFGANIGVASIRYTSSEFIREDAVSPDDFDVVFTDEDGKETITRFVSAKNTYSYKADGTGVYGKFGLILTPWKGLRVGASIQTPTAFTVREKLTYGSEGNYDNSAYSGNATCEGKFEYNLKSPMRTNFGVAYTFGKHGVLSMDYEFTNYRRMMFSVPGTSDNSEFDDANDGIMDICGVQHYLRLGAEIKPLDFLSVRLGYNCKTSGQKYEYDGSELMKAPSAVLHTVSGGLGFSAGMFFADFAAVGYFYPTEYVRPYPDYIFEGNAIATYSPEIRYRRNLVKIVATLGIRF